MIDIACETLITLAEAARLRPPSRGGRPTHTSTIYRWASRGIRGVRLEVIRLGAVTYTSSEAMQRFADRLTPDTSSSAPATANRKATDAALDDIGI